jgi:hypothetical protein
MYVSDRTVTRNSATQRPTLPAPAGSTSGRQGGPQSLLDRSYSAWVSGVATCQFLVRPRSGFVERGMRVMYETGGM